MRVISGEYRGRRLACPKSDVVRPTTDKVKEAMFGAIQFDIPNSVVLDAFAGSGSLGIEALSRGATHVDFVEKNSGCLRTLSSNLKQFNASNWDIFKGDVLKVMPSLKKYDIVFLDPPYDAEFYLPMLTKAHENEILKKDCTIVMECRRTFDFDLPKEYNLTKKKNYGEIALWFMKYGE